MNSPNPEGKRRMMSLYDACGMVAGFVDCESHAEYLDAAAFLVKTGIAWQFEGTIGRGCNRLIEAGYISESGEVITYEIGEQ